MDLDDLTKLLIRRSAIKNDDFRKSLPVNALTSEIVAFKAAHKKERKEHQFNFSDGLIGGHLIISPLVFWHDSIWEILKTVKNYSMFDKDNDPHGERIFGDLKIGKETIFWKFDFYQDSDCKWGCSNHLKNPCWRVLTIYNSKEH